MLHITAQGGVYRTVINRVSRLLISVYMSLGVIVEGLYFVPALCLCLLLTCTETDKHQTKLEHILIRLLLKKLLVFDRACSWLVLLQGI